MQLLHLDSSILGANSVSRILSASAVAKLRAVHPDAVVTYRDLAADPLPHLSGAALGAMRNVGGDLSPALQEDLAVGEQVMNEFLAAEVVVIGVAFYNFSIASQLKAWIDRIVVGGKTFRYGPEGRPEGLAGDKRVVLAIARGGFYGVGTPAHALEHAESYLRSTLAFIGITNLEVVAAEGTMVGPEQREASIAGANQQIDALAA